MTDLCAICTHESPEMSQEYIDGKLVNVCHRCNTEHPRQGGYTFEETTKDDKPCRATPSRISDGSSAGNR